MAQISRQIASNSMNVIFAVPGSMVPTYRDLSSRLLGASVGELTNDSSNIVALVKDQYNVSSIIFFTFLLPVTLTFSKIRKLVRR